MVVNVTAEQFVWSFTYPGRPVAIGDLRLPVDRQVELKMRSKDVIHDFYVPEFRVKQDVVPGITTTLIINPDKHGDLPGDLRGALRRRPRRDARTGDRAWSPGGPTTPGSPRPAAGRRRAAAPPAATPPRAAHRPRRPRRARPRPRRGLDPAPARAPPPRHDRATRAVEHRGHRRDPRTPAPEGTSTHVDPRPLSYWWKRAVLWTSAASSSRSAWSGVLRNLFGITPDVGAPRSTPRPPRSRRRSAS